MAFYRSAPLFLGKLKLSLVAPLLLGTGYLGLLLFLGTSSPFLIVQGTSMEPAFHAGDLLLARNIPATEIKVGDIIAFNVPTGVPQMPPTAAHRVIGIEGDKGQLVFATQGDNSDIDPFRAPYTEVHGVVLKNLGPLGRPILLVTNGRGLLYLGLPILTFIVIVLATLLLNQKQNSRKGLGN